MVVRKGYNRAWRFFGKLIVLGIMVVALQHDVHAEGTWWNEDWQYRKQITLDTTPTGADVKTNLTDVQVLLRLHTGNMNFANAKEDGSDIRFVAGDDKTVLKHHLESFDGQEELALVWVNVPVVTGGTNQDFIWMYYGNGEAVGGEDERGAFGSVSAVFHFREIEGLPADSSEKNITVDQFAGSMGLPSLIGSGISMNGLSDKMTIKTNPLLDMKDGGFTFSSWVKIAASLDNAVLFSRTGERAELLVGVDKTNLFAQIAFKGGRTFTTEKTAALSPGTWHHVAASGSPDGMLTVFVDGIKIDWVNTGGRLPAFNGDMALGSSVNGDRFFAGELDEVRISAASLTEDRIRMEFASQGQEKTCVTAGEEVINEGGGLHSGSMGIVFKNITLDGWLIIGSLTIMGAMCWIIILTKGFSFHLMNKENNLFRDSSENADEKMAFMGSSIEFANSSLYRLNRVAAKVMGKLIDPSKENENIVLSSKELAYFKSEIEKGMIKETGQMNSWLTVLTMSVSGAPFLGLLGTVWGVMTTFAAIAEAGEANILAIAPGVASALAATVFGLLVAIPALFGYNYLVTKVRSLTIDTHLYVDELCLLADRLFGGDK